MNTVQANITGRKPTAVDQPSHVEPEELLSATDAAMLLHQRPQTLAGWRCDNKGPEYVKIGRAVFYRRAAISAWLATQIVRPGV
jgi:hypothetical protein